ncbi:nicotinate-nucleotide adenylyltransferase [Oceanicola sp. D3]|uniref:nicotinate-nucleotide adenylyltransferase n=1 Tax=Oceanicola sp. D3 TaxID=2587163 RepID=UPI00111D7518|nr:nicotinate-nucleotide adenylyltransferase [Oceanicola sp. D3]QDC08459.1 nicotinate-nucleotide adenylyltransferase [Oceanicola sp. D3]
MRWDIPYAAPGQTVGLLGGSFDPAHEGHVHVTREALKRFGLDAVWWLVSPGNPLKSRGPAPMGERIAEARALLADPRVVVTGIEARLGTRYTAETLAGVQRLYPRVHFTWLMGADNLAQFHLWDRWQDIMATVPVGVIARPGQRLSARMSKAAERFARSRLPAAASHTLPRATPPAWCFINIPMSHQSSTAIRAKRAAAKK